MCAGAAASEFVVTSTSLRYSIVNLASARLLSSDFHSKTLKHVLYAAASPVVVRYEAGCLSLDILNSFGVLFGGWVPYRRRILHNTPYKGLVTRRFDGLGAAANVAL